MHILGAHVAPEFDWYQATFPDADPEQLMEQMESHLELTHIERQEHGGRGYRRSALLMRGEDVAARMLYDGQAPNIQASSHRAILFADVCRQHYPRHRVSRADVCFDWCSEGAWDTLRGVCEEVAEEHNVMGQMISPINSEGHTLRLGSPKSNVSCNLYEKGFEQRAKKRGWKLDKAELEYADPNWVRWEVRCRPQKKAKEDFATYDPLTMAGSTKWTKNLAERLQIAGVDRVKIDPRTETDWERTHGFMIGQYGRHLLDGAEHLYKRAGEPENVHPLDLMLGRLRDELLGFAKETEHPLSKRTYIDPATGEIR